MIYKFQPFSISKDVGLEYNAHCELVPFIGDWILILDYDAMILSPKSYEIMEKAIAKYPDTQIFGAMTNRVGLSFQRMIKKEPDPSDSIKRHIRIAEVLAHKFRNGESFQVNQVAGFFMLFRKSYWMENNFQEKVMDKRGNLFDYTFSRPAGRAGAIRIINGVYVFHQYRLMKEWKDKSHLK